MKYNTIHGLQGRECVGACVTIGVKSSRGFPTETDRWHIVNPREESGVKKLHPAFAAFNSAAPERRKILLGNIVHARQQECFEYHLMAQVISLAHPNRMPACTGDGVRATRWRGPGPDDFIEMKCANELCENRMRKPPVCKPWMRFLFRIRWREGSTLPSMVVKFVSRSWDTTANFRGFFEYLEKVARELGLREYTLFGFPFSLNLQYRTKPSEKQRFPVVAISPELDPVEFFMRQREKIKQLAQDVPVALTDESEQHPDVIYEDVRAISVPASLPGDTGRKKGGERPIDRTEQV